VYGIKTLRLGFGQAHHFQGFDLQAAGLNAADDFSDKVAGNTVGFDNR
jgi:hypothetical protein